MRLWTLLFAAFAIGCDGNDPKDTGDTDTDTDTTPLDVDSDGFTEEDGDCDDGDATVNPDADEVWYDGVDQNCDQLDDYDQDQDGASQDEDCDDLDADISPDAAELCDEIDNDCDGEVDESGEFTAYLDEDADGFGAGEPLGVYCELPEGTSSNDEDCDDTNPATNPTADEVCDGVDNDCDGEVDIGAVDGVTAYSDADADGYGDAATATAVCALGEGQVEDATDCDDTDALTFPGAGEVCDLKDNNCDGTVDEGATEGRTYYADADADGYGDPAVTVTECGAPAGYVEEGTDCDDADATRSPAAAEICDSLDNDCDGEVDTDPTDGVTVYADVDGDGYGDDATMTAVCTVGAGLVETGGDCDDTATSVSPGAAEVCDGIDNNCDVAVDESTAADAATWYIDADADGYGDGSASATACSQPTGFVGTDDDCNDGDATVNPAATELCDELDNDCDGAVDDGAGAATWYADTDGDGFGDASATMEACEQPAGYLADATDCDDTDVLSYPGASETCDGEDQDCDGLADDDAIDGFTAYADADGDGYGDAAATASVCALADGWTADASDCDDGSFAVNPGATEVCNGGDDDCDGTADEADAEGTSTWYDDRDGDGFGDAVAATTACDAPVGTVANATDCDDSAVGTYPGAAETCDSVDQDCDGSVDDDATDAGTWYADTDTDGFGAPGAAINACDRPSGYVATATDCDDGDDAAFPGATETCDDADNDCDGSVDEAGATGGTTWYVDADSDGYGVSTGTTDACDMPTGYAATADDCDDTDATASPGTAEADDGVDNDCDGAVDEGFVVYGDLVITEFSRQPRVGGSATNTDAQWFEVYNTTTEDLDLSDWYVTRYVASAGRDGFYIDPTDDVIVGAESYAVFCKTDNYTAAVTSASELICDYYWSDESVGSSGTGTYYDNTFNLQRDEDTLSFYQGGDHTTGTLIDAVHWTYDATNGYWPRDATRATQLDRDYVDADENDAVDNWCSVTNNVYFQWYYVSSAVREFGTPGTENHTCP